MSTTIRVCDGCAAGIVNDDWTHIDGECDSQEDADQAYTSILGSLEHYGWLTPIGKGEPIGAWDCVICGNISCGDGHIMECTT